MDAEALIPFLALMTLLAVCVFGIVSKRKTDQRREDMHKGKVAKSTLAEDAPNKSDDETRY